MTIKLNEIHEIIITVNADNSCTVDFMECGRKLNSEAWASINDVIEEYC